jgi:hypothetical protein
VDESGVAFGITPEIAKALYQRLYALKYLSSQTSRPSVHMYPNVEVLDIVDATIGARMTARAIDGNNHIGRLRLRVLMYRL